MPEQSNELRRINWSECFHFTLIFRTFRMALHPSKLGLALGGIVLMGLWGWLLDGLWLSGSQSIRGEIDAYWQTSNLPAWREVARLAQTEILAGALPLADMNKDADAIRDKFKKSPAKVVDEVLDGIKDHYRRMERELKKKAGDEAVEQQAEALAELSMKFNEKYKQVKQLKPQGVFRAFLQYEQGVIRRLLDAGLELNFVGRLGEVFGGRSHTPMHADPDLNGMGVVSCVVLAARGKQWMLSQHPWYAVFFLSGALCIWALLGGAICRMAAMNIARDERMTVRSAVGFAARKFLSLVTAPLLPIGLIVGIGIGLMVLGLIGMVPWIGDLIAGLSIPLVLMGGFVMALVVVGAVAGGAMFWPTIAVEGSDGFDAISRSYSYIFSKPWRTALYAIIATVYGAICYHFLRLFVFVMLVSSRRFFGLFPGLIDRPEVGDSGASKLDAVWPAPSLESLMPHHAALGLTGHDRILSFFVCLWVAILVCLLCAYLVTFFFSGSTVIYYLLRREVDATDLEDVYLDEDLDQDRPAEPAAPANRETPLPVVPASGPPTTETGKPASAESPSTKGGGSEPPSESPPQGESGPTSPQG